MMKLLYCLLIFFAGIITSQAQSTIRSPFLGKDTVVLVKGIYRNYEEFISNNPSEKVGFTVKEKNRIYNKFHSHTQYRVEFSSEQDKNAIKLEECWGFCDGFFVYMFSQKNIFGKDNFEKILFVGKYCGYVEFVFMGSPSVNTNIMNPYSGTPIMTGGSESFVLDRAIDLETGEIHTLNKKKVTELLSSDPELLAKFSADKKKNKMKFEYLQQFNERYKLRTK